MIYNLPEFWYGRSTGFEFPFSNESLTQALLEMVEEDD